MKIAPQVKGNKPITMVVIEEYVLKNTYDWLNSNNNGESPLGSTWDKREYKNEIGDTCSIEINHKFSCRLVKNVANVRFEVRLSDDDSNMLRSKYKKFFKN